MIGDRHYMYECSARKTTIAVLVPLERLPGVVTHSDGGIMHYLKGGAICGPLRQIADVAVDAGQHEFAHPGIEHTDAGGGDE